MPLTAARLPLLLLAVFASVLLVNLGTLWLLTDRIFQTELAPVVQNKGFVVGDTLARRLEDAVQLGVPLDELVDREKFREQIRRVLKGEVDEALRIQFPRNAQRLRWLNHWLHDGPPD